MIERKRLLADLQKQVRLLEADLRHQVECELPETKAALRAEYDRAFSLNRTASTWAGWLDGRVTQAAVAWVLGTVFVRFCEDNGMLAEPFIAGPSPERLAEAQELQADFLAADAARTHRDWLLAAFGEIGAGQAGRLLLDPRHNALYQVNVSHLAARELIAFWRTYQEGETLVHDFTDESWDTRFLGDLYEGLSEAERRTYALLQTPKIVEEFILDRALTPAIAEFGYNVVTMIDPVCGSGHFVLGTFARLLAEWERNAPEADRRTQIGNALNAVHGVDINPAAVAIARFRLYLAAMRAAGLGSLSEAAIENWPLHLVIGDSLIKPRSESGGLFAADGNDPLAGFKYATEDLDDQSDILEEGRYHVVVGNPPYIVVKDKSLNALYRSLYQSCSGKYALSIPFAERFFQLAKPAGVDGSASGYVGQITSNSFMKREFGKKLIEEYFAHEVDLTHLIDTSGVYIPGHGTPTVILIGRRRSQGRADTVRASFGLQGEPSPPDDPVRGLVWSAILDQIDHPGSQSNWITVQDVSRASLERFPWTLSDRAEADLLDRFAGEPLSSLVSRIGYVGATGSDEAFIASRESFRRDRAESTAIVTVLTGSEVRDWLAAPHASAFFPRNRDLSVVDLQKLPGHARRLWPYRTTLGDRRAFGGESFARSGRAWYDWHQLSALPDGQPFITYSWVATHPQFALVRDHIIPLQSAPVVQLPIEANSSEALSLLGVLNSSAVAYWLRKHSVSKGGAGDRQIVVEPWESFIEITGVRLNQLPLPDGHQTVNAAPLDELAQRLNDALPDRTLIGTRRIRQVHDWARADWQQIRSRMIALQEELDWQVYGLYNLAEDLRAPADSVPPLDLGQRAFEIVLARRIAVGETHSEWFNRHGSTPITELPSHWPDAYKQTVERRIETIASNSSIALIERPECKRRWVNEGWDQMWAGALREWLLDRIEDRGLWFGVAKHGTEHPRPRTVAELADLLEPDEDFVAVAEYFAPDKPLVRLLTELLADEHVPFASGFRYRPSGLRKRQEWERVWELQRTDDLVAAKPEKQRVEETTRFLPKYTSADFTKLSYWRKRGKLDVPKERFISYPGASPDDDPSLLIGWAGWDHREQALVLAALIHDRDEDQGWGGERLKPLLAGLLELQPWLGQWHDDYDPEVGMSIAQSLESFRAEYQLKLDLTEEDLRSWSPPPPRRGRPPSKSIVD